LVQAEKEAKKPGKEGKEMTESKQKASLPEQKLIKGQGNRSKA
jgi:hypothetical protein